MIKAIETLEMFYAGKQVYVSGTSCFFTVRGPAKARFA